MSSDQGKSDELGADQTTPGAPPIATEVAPSAPQPLAAGSAYRPDTLDMPAAEGGALPEPGPGATIGRFVVRARLGAGGMGVVYAGEDTALGRPVAIKIVRGDAEHPAYRERLLREAQAMAKLEHPNVVRVYEVGTASGRTFVAMELVEGTTLAQWLHAARTWREVLALFEQAGEGLLAVHRAGLVHRDFKPDNVLVDRKGQARVADFGLARMEVPEAAQLTKTGAIMGTPGYMAPEQQLGAGEVDARADQYSFCVALREAFGGRPLDETRWKLIPEPVRTAIKRGLSYDPDERHASMDVLLTALRAGARERAPRWPLVLGGLAVLGLAAGVVAYVGARSDSPSGTAAAGQSGSSGSSGSSGTAMSSGPSGTAMASDSSGTATASGSSGSSGTAMSSGSSSTVEPPAAIADRGAGFGGAEGHGRPATRPSDVGISKPARVPPPERAVPSDAGVVAIGPNGAGDNVTMIPVHAPTSKHLPQARPGAKGHIEVVRAAIRELGYDGVDAAAIDRAPADIAKALEAEAANATGVDAQIANAKLGVVERRRGNCKRAQELWIDPHGLLGGTATDDAQAWGARANLGIALCALADGDGDTAYTPAMKSWLHGNRDEAQLVGAFALYESGKANEAYAMLLTASHSPNARVQTALKVWLEGLGLGL